MITSLVLYYLAKAKKSSVFEDVVVISVSFVSLMLAILTDFGIIISLFNL